MYDNDNKGTMFGDSFFDGGENNMAQFETYENFEVNDKSKTFVEDARRVIESICSTYLALPDKESIENVEHYNKIEKLIDGIKYVEISNLGILIKQVKIAEHILDTLLRRMDSGGFTEDSLYHNIREQQKDLLKMVMEFSKYTRNLHDYFSVVRSEIGLNAPLIEIEQQQKLNSNVTETIDISSEEDGDEEYVALPMRGTKDLALSFQESIQKLKDKQSMVEEVITEFDPKELDEEYDDE